MKKNKRLLLAILSRFDTQYDFARAIGKSESYVSNVIRGKKQLSMVEQGKWTAALDCKSEDIFGKPNENPQ
jgi:hypothetical protein